MNRLTFGAKPADLARVRELGPTAYVDWQLDHRAIPDPRIDGFLAENPVLLDDESAIRRALDADRDEVFRQFMWGRIYRAVTSERQLFEKVVEFWTDHFNVPLPSIVPEKMVFDREVVRKHALGHFRDMLVASARSPAMLIYLDNASSHKDHPNQNYAREVMELHTLGVDGGYAQQDVEEVARCFTGWTLQQGWRGEMIFDRGIHDEGEKIVLGRRIAAGRGIEDGLQVLDILATHPATAKFISRKLCSRFVSDDPPTDLVDEVAATFRSTEGDMRAVLRTLFTSTRFKAARGTKFRRPFESLVAMLRALDPAVQVHDQWLLGYALERMGHLPFHWFPPNGYPDTSAAWLNVNGLLHRWNTAMVLAYASQGWTDGAITFDIDAVIPESPTVGALVDSTWQRLVGDPIDATTRRTLLASLDSASPGEPVTDEFRSEYLPPLVGLILSSPAFQLT